MSTSWYLFLLVSVCFVDVGNSLQCYSYQCAKYVGAPFTSPPCSQPKPVTCGNTILGTPADRCMTQRFQIKTNIAGNDITMNQEVKNCTSSVQCNVDLFCKTINATSKGGLKKCEMSCCKGDLCNTGVIPTPGPKPTNTGPTGSDLSCYECGSGNMKFNASSGIPTNDCKNPIKKKCGTTGIVDDRCLQGKVRAGDSEYEFHRCGNQFLCNKQAICAVLKIKMGITGCDISCCYGNLCNVPAASTTPSSGGTVARGAMSCLLVMLAGMVVLFVKME